MKKFNVIHKTEYHYPYDVQLMTHILRLRPREGHDLRISSSRLRIEPNASISWLRDVEGNSIARATFSEKTRFLDIESEIVIEKYDLSPSHFTISEHAVNYPFSYNKCEQALLSPYLNMKNIKKFVLVDEWIKKLGLTNGHVQTFSLLCTLNQFINSNFSYIAREEEGIQEPELTLRLCSGTCRDFAFLFMIAAQRIGLASRFVSGYAYSEVSANFPGTTHAWTEVYIPGAGWKGFDPTSGLLAGVGHIPVAVSSYPELTSPISGEYYGINGSTMKVFVLVTDCQ